MLNKLIFGKHSLWCYVKSLIPRQLKRMVHAGISHLTYKKYLRPPTLENLPANTMAFAHKHRLNQAIYFNNYQGWKLNRRDIQVDERMSLQHYAFIDYLGNFPLPSDAMFLDVCCGMGHLFIFLQKILGYSNFTGVDDSTFQPEITLAANDLLRYYGVDSRLLNFNNVAFPPYYSQFKDRFDVFSHFVVDTFYFYPIAYHIIKPGGLYIAELEDPDPGIYSDCFEVIKIYNRYGRIRESGQHAYQIVVMRKIKNKVNIVTDK